MQASKAVMFLFFCAKNVARLNPQCLVGHFLQPFNASVVKT